jgi:predicted O-methyltransferase YrrM
MTSSLLNFSKRAAHGVHRRINSFSIQRALESRGLGESSRIQTFTAPDELEMLFQLARGIKPDARVLEIGSYLGASTCYLAAGLRGANATITCIDTWQNQTMPEGVRDTFAEFGKNLQPVRQRLTLIRKPSRDVTPKELDGQFDLVFLDGDHSYEPTRADFNLVASLISSDGVLAFHDSIYFEGVSRVIGEALASAKWQIGGHVRNLFWIKPAKFTHGSVVTAY